MSEMILGIDLGTSSVKLVLTDLRGRVIASAGQDYPIIGKDEGRYEQDPGYWTLAISTALKVLAQDHDLKLIRAIGLSGQMPSLVLIDKTTGKYIGNSILWPDPRADGIAASLLEKWGPERYYSETGIVLDGHYLAPMYLWAQEFGQAENRIMISAKDYICYWLCGELVTDPSTASGYALYSLRRSAWDRGLCDEAGISLESLPKIIGSSEVAGRLKANIAHDLGLDPDTVVAAGGADSVCGALGMGATEPGTVCQIWGTSTALIGITEKLDLSKPHAYFITPMLTAGTYGMEADLISTGVSYKWLQDLIGTDVTQTAKKAPPGSDGLLFYPYVSGGEQGVLWDPDLKAGMIGLSYKHEAAHIARALLEGRCFEAKRCMDAFDMDIIEVFCTGKAPQESFQMQMFADVFGIECISLPESHSSALGAAFIGGIAAGIWDMKDIRALALAEDEKLVYRPNEEEHKRYTEIYKKYINNTGHMKLMKNQ